LPDGLFGQLDIFLEVFGIGFKDRRYVEVAPIFHKVSEMQG
jgi:hypothetical protein